ncbi:TPA: hypothetical protein KRL47_001310 [Clostridioides difficile]|nr:hypothetical protein [Clostridioides difficile]
MLRIKEIKMSQENYNKLIKQHKLNSKNKLSIPYPITITILENYHGDNILIYE